MKDVQTHRLSDGPQQEEAPRQEPRGKQPDWNFAGKSVRVLFLCTHNQARSQMTEALLHHLSQGQIEALSAGNHPVAEVHPLAVRAIAMLGADMSRHVPKSLDFSPGDPLRSQHRISRACPITRADQPGAGARSLS